MRPKAEWAIDSEAMRAREIMALVKIQLVGQKYRDITTLLSKRYSAAIVLVFKVSAFSLLVGYNM